MWKRFWYKCVINVCVCVWEGFGGVGGRLHLKVRGIFFGLHALLIVVARTKGRGAEFAVANPHHLLLGFQSRQLSVEGKGVSVDKGAAAAIGGGPWGGVGVGISLEGRPDGNAPCRCPDVLIMYGSVILDLVVVMEDVTPIKNSISVERLLEGICTSCS